MQFRPGCQAAGRARAAPRPAPLSRSPGFWRATRNRSPRPGRKCAGALRPKSWGRAPPRRGRSAAGGHGPGGDDRVADLDVVFAQHVFEQAAVGKFPLHDPPRAGPLHEGVYGAGAVHDQHDLGKLGRHVGDLPGDALRHDHRQAPYHPVVAAFVDDDGAEPGGGVLADNLGGHDAVGDGAPESQEVPQPPVGDLDLLHLLVALQGAAQGGTQLPVLAGSRNQEEIISPDIGKKAQKIADGGLKGGDDDQCGPAHPVGGRSPGGYGQDDDVDGDQKRHSNDHGHLFGKHAVR